MVPFMKERKKKTVYLPFKEIANKYVINMTEKGQCYMYKKKYYNRTFINFLLLKNTSTYFGNYLKEMDPIVHHPRLFSKQST